MQFGAQEATRVYKRIAYEFKFLVLKRKETRLIVYFTKALPVLGPHSLSA